MQINKTKEYPFGDAWSRLVNDNNMITSKNSNYSYIIDKNKDRLKLKFYNPMTGVFQICTYFSSDELLDNWYITDKN